MENKIENIKRGVAYCYGLVKQTFFTSYVDLGRLNKTKEAGLIPVFYI